ncbi:MAG: TonB family protein [Ignavibacteria bacterium]|nr:TonB family protein [Ignavibacteria bacterium]
MAETLEITMPAPSGYGAAELKEYINRFTVRAFVITISLSLLLLIQYALIKTLGTKKPLMMAPIARMSLTDIPPPSQTDEVQAPPPQQIINTGPAARAGIPLPVPEAMLKDNLQDFATMKDLGRASAEGGSGIDMGGFASNIDFDAKDVNVRVREEEPSPDEFIPVEKEPNFDYDRLMKLAKFPDIARRAGIEGKVQLRVLVYKDGKIKRDKIIIEYTDSELLNDAAVKAIVDYGQLIPAVQNGQPVQCWVSIPIIFKLR